MVRYLTNIRKSQFISTQHTFSFRAANTVFSDGRAAWHANCLEDFGPDKDLDQNGNES